MFAFLLLLNEAEQGVDVRQQLIVGSENFAGMIQTDLRPIEQPMGFRKAADGFGGKLFRFSATTLMHRGRAGSPSHSIYGGTSCRTRVMPAVNE